MWGERAVVIECVTAFMQDLQSKEVANLKKWFGPVSRLWMPPGETVEGDSRILATFRKIFSRYKELNWKVTQIYSVNQNKFIYETESWGVIGENKPYKNRILTIIEFDEDGKIVFLSDYFKDTAIFAA